MPVSVYCKSALAADILQIVFEVFVSHHAIEVTPNEV